MCFLSGFDYRKACKENGIEHYDILIILKVCRNSVRSESGEIYGHKNKAIVALELED